MSKKFTSNMQPPTFGQKIGLKSPILEAYSTSQNSTRGVVTELIDMGANSFDRCVVNFRGRSIRATCCHPGITVGSSVCMIEQPRGIWYATVMQKSWYSRPLTDLLDKGKPVQAAVEWLLSFGPKWQPRLIFIDKRGAEKTPYVPPVLGPGFVVGYTETTWPYDPEYFGDADKNGDGFVDEFELVDWIAGGGDTDLRPGDEGGFWVEFVVINGRVLQVRWSFPKSGGEAWRLDRLWCGKAAGADFSTGSCVVWAEGFGPSSYADPGGIARRTYYISDINQFWIGRDAYVSYFWNATDVVKDPRRIIVYSA